MAVTRRPNSIQHTAAGDASTGRLVIERLIWTGIGTDGDDLACKNGDGTVLGAYKGGANVPFILEWPFGHVAIDGLETDVLDSGNVEYVLA